MTDPSHPTADEVLEGIDLTGQTVAITGASGGIGLEGARSLAAAGAHVICLSRRLDALEQGAQTIREQHPEAEVSVLQVDLADQASVVAAGDAIESGPLAGGQSLDVLINNAGVMCCPWGTTADGFERQFGTNHLGHARLTSVLAPALRRAEAPRVVTLSSSGHSIAPVDLDDPNFDTTEYDPWVAYGRSKSANALFALALARRLDGDGLSFSVHPGMILTDLGRHLTAETMAQLQQRMADRETAAGRPAPDSTEALDFKSIPQGAATSVWAATSPDLVDHNGAYLGDVSLGVLDGNTSTNGYQPHIADIDTAERLWSVSEALLDTALTV